MCSSRPGDGWVYAQFLQIDGLLISLNALQVHNHLEVQCRTTLPLRLKHVDEELGWCTDKLEQNLNALKLFGHNFGVHGRGNLGALL